MSEQASAGCHRDWWRTRHPGSAVAAAPAPLDGMAVGVIDLKEGDCGGTVDAIEGRRMAGRSRR